MKRFTKTTALQIWIGILPLILGLIIWGCGPSQTGSQDAAEESAEVVMVVEEYIWIIDEHKINDIPMTTMAETQEIARQDLDEQIQQETEAAEEELESKVQESIGEEAAEMAEVDMIEEAAEEAAYEILTMAAMADYMAELEYEAQNTVMVTEAIIPLEETQTLVAYNKKGKELSEVQVVSAPDGEVEQVIFTDKKHSHLSLTLTVVINRCSKR